MFRLSVIRKRAAFCRRLSRELGRPWLPLFVDVGWCRYRHGTCHENYYVLRFFRLSEKQRRCYLTSGRSKVLDRELNRSAAPEQLRLLYRKDRFNRRFSAWVHREYLYLPKASPDELAAFLLRNPRFILKPVSATQGKGLRCLRAADISDPALFLQTGAAEKLLAEQCIPQCSALARLHPASVNTVRINVARTPAGKLVFIGACLKCGRGEAAADNFHAGGIAWPLELDTGRVCGPGRDNLTLNEYTAHPDSGVEMPGFVVPRWTEILAAVRDAMALVPSLGYVGWDIAVAEWGVELIEGNVHWPGGNIIQFDNIGKAPLLRSCIR